MRWLVIFLAACTAPATPHPADWRDATIAHLEARSTAWVEHPPDVGENVPCAMSCHTTHSYLVVRAKLGPTGAVFEKVRGAIEQRVTAAGSLRTATSYYGDAGSDKERESRGTEAVLNFATLALAGDVMRDTTRVAFDRMWEMQRADGGFDWLDFDLEPWESTGDWGAALAARATAAMPASSRAAHQPAIDRLAGFLRARSAELGLHDQIELLRAVVAWPELATAGERAAIVAAITTEQRPDGGWALADWGRGARTGGDSDAYATGYATVALCEAGHRDARAIAWLVAHRNADGSWTGRSVNNADAPNQLFISDAATAYAALALVTCR